MRSVFALLLVLAASPRSARADTAAELKTQGIAAANAKNWELARQKFEASYALDPLPTTLYDLATAQERTDKLIEARNSYTTFLVKTKPANKKRPGALAKFRKVSEAALARLATTIPTLLIKPSGFTSPIAFELDGRPVSDDEASTAVLLDPGEHTVVVLRGTEPLARKSVIVSAGGRYTIEISPPAPKPEPRPPEPRPLPLPPPVKVTAPPPPVVVITAPLPPARPPPRRGRSIFASGWFWGITTVIVVGVAGAGYYKYVYETPGDPTRGTLVRGAVGVP